MNRLFFLIIPFFGLVGDLVGQNFESDIHFGFNASQIDGDQFSGYSKLGLHAGMIVNYRMNERWKLGSGIFFDALGSQKEIQRNNNPEEQAKIQLSYLSIPLIALYQNPTGDNFLSKLGFKGGFRFSYLVGSKFMDRTDEPILDFYSTTDIAATLGIEYTMNEKWKFSLQAFESLTLLFNNNKTQEINANSLRMRNLTFAFIRHL